MDIDVKARTERSGLATSTKRVGKVPADDSSAGFALGGPSPADLLEAAGKHSFDLIVPVNIVLAGLLSALSVAGVVAVVDAHLAAVIGTSYLFGSLVLPNLRHFERFASSKRARSLAKLRRPLGISSGVWFVAHAFASLRVFFDPRLPLPPQFAREGSLFGLVALVVFAALLLTSNNRSKRMLGKNWKRLHRLVWFVVPFILAHAVLSSERFLGHNVEPPVAAGLGGIAVFTALEYFALRSRGARKAWTHLGLIGAGTAAVLLYLVA